jgi:hypothetical protein
MVALFSVGVEYCALMEGIKEVIWSRNLSTKIKHIKPRTMTMFRDNVSSIKMAKNQVFHARTKCIECHYHFVCEKVLLEEIDIKHVSSCQ